MEQVRLNEIQAVPTELVFQAWPNVAQYVAKALEHGFGEYSLENMLVDLASGRSQLWVAGVDNIELVCITEVIVYPQRRSCNIWLLAGENLEKWSSYLQAIEDWALAKGCTLLEYTGRPGLAKHTKQLGFKVIREVAYKPLLRNMT